MNKMARKQESKLEILLVFSKCDLRVGKIISCIPIAESEVMYQLLVDIGEDQPRLIATSYNGKISIEEMTKGLIVVFINIKPKKILDLKSNGMILGANTPGKTIVELIRPPDGSIIGERV